MVERKEFFLGKIFNPKQPKTPGDVVELDPADLTTHGVIIGMTGSGKTGLGVVILEEAALQGIPAIVLDPKGDLTNLLMHFPEQRAEDFKPWIDPEEAKRAGKTVDQQAVETAAMWKDGLAGWGLGKNDLQALNDSVEFTIYTPGSTAGIPVNILSSFEAPDMDWEENAEMLRDRISSTVTAILGLVGMEEIDPLRSKEHILLSNLLENAWSAGKSLEMHDLILLVQNPPMERLGAFPLDSFYPEKERSELAILLNNILASPSFKSWIEGQRLDIGQLLYSNDGKPRHSVFYLAAMDESERMFFVTLLFTAIDSWMRTQRGTGNLRALIYFDEILGFLPPVANPPSKSVILRMLKQARAFGVGLLLATQNPVDLDYKSLTNTGAWMIGRLQAERDKDRLLDGLESAAGGMDRGEYNKLISGLAKRVFLLHSVKSNTPKLFSVRWAMNYLAGPVMKSQIDELNALAGAQAPRDRVAANQVTDSGSQSKPVGGAKRPSADTAAGISEARPSAPGGIAEYFLPNDLPVDKALAAYSLPVGSKVAGLVYQPALLAQADVRYFARSYNFEYINNTAVLMPELEPGLVRWEAYTGRYYKPDELSKQPQPNAAFKPLPAFLSDSKKINSLQNDFEDWIYRTGNIYIKANKELKVVAGPDVSEAEFVSMLRKATRGGSGSASKLGTDYQKKIDVLKQKIERQKLEVDEKEEELNARRLDEAGAGAGLLMGMLGVGRKKSVSSNITKRRMTAKAKAALEQEEHDLETLVKQLETLEKERDQALAGGAVADSGGPHYEEIPLSPSKKDIYLSLYGLAWAPYYRIEAGGEKLIPAYRD
ncbi:MAG: ATP-binding protein [Anaerolineae bacterium]|nr:ATP-binding protein [Anaerolineae bacterium]